MRYILDRPLRIMVLLLASLGLLLLGILLFIWFLRLPKWYKEYVQELYYEPDIHLGIDSSDSRQYPNVFYWALKVSDYEKWRKLYPKRHK